jgi:hypothetical protein
MIRCLRDYLIQMCIEVDSAEDIYRKLEEPPGTYLEDIHLMTICEAYGINALVLRVQAGKAVFCHYDTGSARTLSMVNYFPNHYVLATFTTDFGQLNPRLIPETLLSFAETQRYVIDGREIMYENMLYEGNESIEPPKAPRILLPISVVVPTEDVAVLYAYLLDTNIMRVASMAEAMDCFYQLHHVLLDFLRVQHHKGFLPPPALFKAYYKFRHNVFSYICLKLRGFEVESFETDTGLTQWLPGSNKTPDFVYEEEKLITLWEFTVGNRYDTVDFYKGGGVYDFKYTAECKQIAAITGKHTIVKVVPCVLDAVNTDEILSILSLEPDRSNREIILDYMNICNKERQLIASCYSASQIKSDAIDEPDFHISMDHDRPELSQVHLFDAEFLSRLVSLNENLKNSAVNLSLKTRKRQSLVYELDNGKFHYEEDFRGHSADFWVDLLNKQDLTRLIDSMRYKSSGCYVSKEKLKGTVPVMSTRVEKPIPLVKWADQPYVTETYFSTEAVYEPGYNDPKSLSEADLVPKYKTDKVAFPSNYLNIMTNMNLEKMLAYNGTAMLANCHVGPTEVLEAVDLFNSTWDLANSDFTFSPKQTFMVPMATMPMTHVELSALPTELMKVYEARGSGNYTRAILSKALRHDFLKPNKPVFDEKVQKAIDEYRAASSDYYYQLRDLGYSGNTAWSDIDAEHRPTLEPLAAIRRQKLKVYKGSLLGGRSTVAERMIHLSAKGQSLMKVEYDKEMLHFGKKGAYGVGSINDHELKAISDYFDTFADRMTRTGFGSRAYPKLYSSHRSVSPKFLTDMKNSYTERWNLFHDKFFNNTLCQQLTFLAANLASFLFNESVKNYNSNYLKLDNLGFSDFLVVCRGGAKIFKNQTSKLFRVMFYIDPQDLKFSGYSENPSFEVIKVEGRVLIATPWSQIRQDILFDYLSLPYTSFNNMYCTYTRTFSDFTNPVPKLIVLPTLLSLHNRRKTESFMHNCRYLVVNVLGEMANIKGIIAGFASFNYTYLDTWLKSCISTNYVGFASRLLTLKTATRGNVDRLLDEHKVVDLWFSEPIASADLLTSFIYSTYMMSKAAVNSSIEQSVNLWEVLEDVSLFERMHADVDGMKDMSLRCDVTNFDPEVYDDDFKYDPVFCQFQGHYLASYLATSTNRSELENVWTQLLQKDLDVIANSNGLRGWDRNNFFNKKGYDIVYQAIEHETEPDYLSDLLANYLDSDHVSAAALIQGDKNTLVDDKGFEDLLFHIVHKIQRGGSREIYCMDLNTKRKQYPIEQFMKHLCKKLPNEFISIPSNKRHSMIHNDFYERPIGSWVKTVKRWVLDCRRWAPHSVFQKYVHFIKGLSPILPAGMVNHFYKFAKGMMSKDFITREHVYNKLKNNHRFKKYQHLLTPDSPVPGAYRFLVKFSFVMGIFNYLSTALHAANQLVASEVIRLRCLKEGLGLVILDPKCHSDDSVVTSYHQKPESVRLTVMLYDWCLKCSNHMLSVKKSQINNNVYLEFLSVLYLFDRLLPVYPKFVSTMPFKPSDDGYSSDLAFCVTQGLELLAQGGSFEECFLLCKTTERFIQTSYNLDVSPDLPPQLLGQFDSHPIELIYLGGMADMVRWYMFDRMKFWYTMNNLWNSKILSCESGELQFTWDMGAYLQPGQIKQMRKYLPILQQHQLEDSWTLKNCKLGNGKLNLLWYLSKLNDRKFRSTLLDEPVARRYARVTGSAKYRSIRSTTGLIPVSAVSVLMSEMDKTEPTGALRIDNGIEQLMEFYASLIADFYKAIETATVEGRSPSFVKEKPVTFIKEMHPLSAIQISHSEYVSYSKDTRAYALLGKRANPARQVKQIDEYLKLCGVDPAKLGPESLALVARRVLSHNETQMRFVTTTVGTSKIIKNMSAVMQLLKHNSYTHTKLTIKSHQAAEIDWKKRSLVGSMPQAALDYVKNYWVCRMITEYGISDLDIYFINPLEREKSLVEELSTEWKLILLSSLESESKPLDQLSYWCHWEHEQIQLGTRWYGHGVCVLKTPEANLRLTCDNGVLTKMEVQSDHIGFFSNSTSWFLHNYFNFSGMNTDEVLSSLVEPDQYYLGYSAESHTYGYHRPQMFDYVILNQVKVENVLPGFTHVHVPRKRIGNHYMYGYDYDKYVDFFIPTSEPAKVGFAGIFDMDKLRANKDNANLRKFLFEVSIDSGEFIQVDREQLKENIHDSKWYRLVYDSDEFPRFVSGKNTDTSLVEGIIKWKKTNPKFGFPNEEELKTLFKSPNTPPFPRKVMEALLRLGESNMPETDYANLMMILASMQPEERLGYMMNNYGYISAELRVDSLVMSVRSTRIFECCKYMGHTVYKVLIPLMDAICSVLDSGAISSPILRRLTKSFTLGTGILVSEGVTLKYMFAQYLIMSFFSEEIFSEQMAGQERLLDIISELWDLGLGRVLNANTQGDQILRTIEFSVSKSIFTTWVLELLDNLAHTSWNHLFKLKPQMNIRRALSENSPAAPFIEQFRSTLVKLALHPGKRHLSYQTADGDYALPITWDHKVGTVATEWKSFTEEGGEDFYGDAVDLGEEDLEWEYYEEEEPDEVPDFAYVVSPIIGYRDLLKVRGTAKNLFVHSYNIVRDIKIVHGHFKIFKAKIDNTSLLRRIQTESEYIIYMGKKLKQLVIPGFTELSWEGFWKTVRESKYHIDKLELFDGVVDKKDFWTLPHLRAKTVHMESYFLRLNQVTVAEEAEKVVEKIDRVTDESYSNPNLESLRSKLAALVKKLKPSEPLVAEEATSSKTMLEDLEAFDLTAMAEEVGAVGEIWSSSGNKEYVTYTARYYDYNTTAQLLTDIEFRSEINALFPEYVDELFAGNVRLSAKTKDRMRKYAQMQIAAMPRPLKPRYKKLRVLIESLFSLTYECNFRQNETMDFVSLVDELFTENLESEEEQDNMFDYVPGDGSIAIEFDLGKILG